MLPKLCHLDNDLEIIIILQYIYCVVHMTYIPYLGTFCFSRYPNVALARNKKWQCQMQNILRGQGGGLGLRATTIEMSINTGGNECWPHSARCGSAHGQGPL